jgi:hypothetical protein
MLFMQMIFFKEMIIPNLLTITVMTNNTDETMVMNPEWREEEIRLAAYYLWKEKGENHGSDAEDWLEAEESFDN